MSIGMGKAAALTLAGLSLIMPPYYVVYWRLFGLVSRFLVKWSQFAWF
jgi:hypothetical protein